MVAVPKILFSTSTDKQKTTTRHDGCIEFMAMGMFNAVRLQFFVMTPKTDGLHNI